MIFIQGNHFGEKGHDYWTSKDYYTTTGPVGQTPADYHPVNGRGTTMVYGKDRSFDDEVMNQLGDHKPRYYDGAAGGWHPILDAFRLSGTALGRHIAGYDQGEKDAKAIIDNLAKDKNGNITETIKIITHSMGGAYGKGFVAALKMYISTLPKDQQKQILISLVAGFDPFQAGDIKADPNIKTTQYKHKGNKNIVGMGWLVNESGLAQEDIRTNTGTSTDHSIFTFFNDISSLAEGTYKWNGTQWVKQ